MFQPKKCCWPAQRRRIGETALTERVRAIHSTSSLEPPKPSRWRKHWHLRDGAVFLNHGSFGACPKPILQLQAELRRQMEAEPVQFLWRRYEERLDLSRAKLARFVGARP